MTEDDLRLLLHAHGWTLHYNRKRSGTYLEATRHRRPKTQTIHLGPLKNLALKTESDILALFVERPGNELMPRPGLDPSDTQGHLYNGQVAYEGGCA